MVSQASHTRSQPAPVQTPSVAWFLTLNTGVPGAHCSVSSADTQLERGLFQQPAANTEALVRVVP